MIVQPSIPLCRSISTMTGFDYKAAMRALVQHLEALLQIDQQHQDYEFLLSWIYIFTVAASAQ